jgi:hypothetical protein
VDRHLDRALGGGGALERAAAIQPDKRSARGPKRRTADHVGPGQSRHQHRGGAAHELGRRRQLDQAAVVEHPDAIGQ